MNRSWSRARRALTALAVLGSTLVAQAPAAHATPLSPTSYGPFWNAASLVANVYDPDNGGIAHTVGASFDPYMIGSQFSDRTERVSEKQVAGGTAKLYLSWWLEDPVASAHGCDASDGNPNEARVEIRSLGGSQIGSTDWLVPITGCAGELERGIRFDADPLDGLADDAPMPAGNYEVYIKISGGNMHGLSTTGDSAAGPGINASVAKGKFEVVAYKYLFGSHPDGNSTTELTQEQASGGVNKNYSLVRDYKPDWDVPSARVQTWAGQGKAIAWSVKPPAWNGATSPWARATADTAMIDNQIRSLQASANQGSGPAFMTYTVGHEPHDNASDTEQGWDGGSGDRKCGSAVSPSGSGGGLDTCHGNVAEYKALYAAVRARRDVACTSTGGTTGGTYGHPCSKVKIAYIGVPSNITPTGTGIVGDDDAMRPAESDYDVLGGDVFNWGCFRKATSTCTDDAHGGNNEWESFEEKVDDPLSETSLLDLARRFSKPLIISELGSHPGCNGSETTNKCNGANTSFSRGTWFTDMFNYLRRDADALEYILGFAYYHANSTHDWRFIDTAAGGDVDNRGLTEYKNGFSSDANFLTTTAGFVPALRGGIADPGKQRLSAAAVAFVPGTSTQRKYQRYRAGVSRWAPQIVDFKSGWDAVNHSAWMTLGFQTPQAEHMDDLRGSDQFLEISAEVDCAWARVWVHPDDPPASGREGYEGQGWDTNIPGAALPYEDTIFAEACEFGNSGRGEFGIGVMRAHLLQPGKHYYATVRLSDIGASTTPPVSNVTLKVQTGTVFDAEQGFEEPAQLDEDCEFSDSDIATWNAKSDAGLNRRLEAAWCTWQDFNHVVVHESSGDLTTNNNTSKYFSTNLMYNQGFEEDTIGYGFAAANGASTAGMQHHVYCNDPTVPKPYDGSCFLEFNQGSAVEDISVYQDRTNIWDDVATNQHPEMHVTSEAALRCRVVACTIQIRAWGLGVNATQVQYREATLQPDVWYICRTDYNHGRIDRTGSDADGFDTHSTARWEVLNKNASNVNLDVDYTFMGGKTNRDDPSPDGHPSDVGHLNVDGFGVADEADIPTCTATTK